MLYDTVIKQRSQWGDGGGRTRLCLGVFLLSPMIFTLASHVRLVATLKQIKWANRKRMRQFAFIKSNSFAVWSGGVGTGDGMIIFPLTQTLRGGSGMGRDEWGWKPKGVLVCFPP